MHIRHAHFLLTTDERSFAILEKPSLRPLEESSKLRPSTILQSRKILPSENREQIRAVFGQFLGKEIRV